MTPKEIKKLSDEELRIKVAELLGWQNFDPGGMVDDDRCPECDRWLGGQGLTGGRSEHDTQVPVPDYPADLNACNDMEESLTDIEFCKYLQTLCGHTKPKVRIEWSGPDAGRACRAKARQRCEAFVAVLDKETKGNLELEEVEV